MPDSVPYAQLDRQHRLALVQASWSDFERRRRREAANALQRRLAMRLQLLPASSSKSSLARA